MHVCVQNTCITYMYTYIVASNSNFQSNFSSVRPQQDFSRSFCSCCCPPLLSYIPCAVRSSFTLCIHFFGCLPLLLVPSTCPYSATTGSLFLSILVTCPNVTRMDGIICVY